MDKRLTRVTDKFLRDIPCDPKGLSEHVRELEQGLTTTTDSKKRVGILGELGVHLRSLGRLNEAKENILKALEIIQSGNLGSKLEVQQKIRLAHVLQWQGLFDQSNELFDKIIFICRKDEEARFYLDFALQHSGKNLFEQKRLKEALSLFEEAIALRIQRNAPNDQIESTNFAIARTKELLNQQQ